MKRYGSTVSVEVEAKPGGLHLADVPGSPNFVVVSVVPRLCESEKASGAAPSQIGPRPVDGGAGGEATAPQFAAASGERDWYLRAR